MKTPIWIPTDDYMTASVMYQYKRYVEHRFGVEFKDYAGLHQWSIADLPLFWESLLDFFGVRFSGTYEKALVYDRGADDFIHVKWFDGIYLSYSEHIFLHRNEDDVAIKYGDERVDYVTVTWKELEASVSCLQQFLLEKGIKKGDRIGGVLNNTIECVAIFLAVNSIGAIWTCCSPDFGIKGIVDRLALVEPKLLFTESTYQYNGKKFDKQAIKLDIEQQIPTVSEIVEVHGSTWNQIFQSFLPTVLSFERVPFDFPIWILYSSGTTGRPKAITHRTGGNLLEHYKALALHQNVQKGDNFLWYTTTGWMMWNYALSSLLCGATLCLYNGSITYREHTRFWDFVRRSEVDHLGSGASYFASIHELTIPDYRPKVIGSTGSPLPDATFENIHDKFPDTPIISLSGGTDVCSAFLSGCPLLPVYAGEIQCRTLGSDIVAYNDAGLEVYNEVGELVIKQPMPSMPLCFWNDKGDTKYRESYFSGFSNVWSDGDWILITGNGGIRMFGRSDATLNRGGVRIGTAEIYNAVQAVEHVSDSLVIATEETSAHSKMILFLKLDGKILLSDVVPKIKAALREQYSPRHIPDLYYRVSDIPYTLSGKKLEIPIKKIFSGTPPEKAVITDVIRNPESVSDFLKIYNEELKKANGQSY